VNKIVVFFVSLILLLSGVFGLFISARSQEATINQAKYNALQLKYDGLLSELKSLQTTYNSSQKSFDNLLKQKKVEVEQLETELDNVRGNLQRANVKISNLEDELEYAQAAWYQYHALYCRVNYKVELIFIWENYTKPLLFPGSDIDYLIITYFTNEKISVKLLDNSGMNVLPEWCFSSSTPGKIRIDLPLMGTVYTKPLYGTYHLKVSGVTWYTVWGMEIKCLQ